MGSSVGSSAPRATDHEATPGAARSHETRPAARLFATRARSLDLASPLGPEDMVVQAMEDASPTKWHLAHVTWFWETFLLKPHLPGYKIFDQTFSFCFNSYYEAVGQRQPRYLRGLLTRPTIAQVFDYRAHVDEGLEKLLARGEPDAELAALIETGINHEQQHQELLLTDILALFAANPLRPAYSTSKPRSIDAEPDPVRWIEYTGGIRQVGHDGRGFAFDNEGPRHEALLRPFGLADRLVTNAEWLAFMEDGGYRTPSLWLADGWTAVNREGWRAPLYFEQHGSGWLQMTLEGLCVPIPAAPVAHVSYFEADAFARWSGKRLPTEFEWEIAAESAVVGDAPADRALRPLPASEPSAHSLRANGPRQMFGDVWQWTQSAYMPYPGYRAPAGAIGEYNGKFMVSQQVLRGASCATPAGHSRATYRNFFYPQQRWQFTGLRLAREVS